MCTRLFFPCEIVFIFPVVIGRSRVSVRCIHASARYGNNVFSSSVLHCTRTISYRTLSTPRRNRSTVARSGQRRIHVTIVTDRREQDGSRRRAQKRK